VPAALPLARLLPWLAAFLLLAAALLPRPALASLYNTELSAEVMSGPDLCAGAPCAAVLPAAQSFSHRKGSPAYVEGYAVAHGKPRLVGYVFLSTDVVDIPAYSGKPVVTLIGMDTHGVITGVRILKHSEPILLAGIPESVLGRFVAQYTGLHADAKMEIGSGDDPGAVGLDAISGATVTAIAENQVIAQSAYLIGAQVGIFKVSERPRAHFTAAPAPRDWAGLLDEGSVQHLLVRGADVGADDTTPYMDLYFGYLNAPGVGAAILGEDGYRRLLQDLGPDEHALFVIASGQVSFKGSGFVRGGIYDRIQVRQDAASFTFRDTDYRNLYQLHAPGAPAYRESGIFIVRKPGFNPAWPWRLSFLANRRDAQTGTKTVTHFDQEYWLPARYLDGGRPKVVRPLAAWQLAWLGKWPQLVAFVLVLLGCAALYAQRDRLVRASTRKRKPWIAVPRHLLWIVSVGFFGLVLKAQPSITQVLTLVQSAIHGWHWNLFLSDPFIFVFWIFIAATLLLWGRGLFCGWLCPMGSLQHLAYRAGQLIGLGRWQTLLPKRWHDRLKWVKYGVFALLLAVSFWSMESAETLAEIEPFKTTFLVGVWNRAWPYGAFVGVIVLLAMLSERPYCKYLCPLGAALAVPSPLRRFGLKRKQECTSCHACATGCGAHAIDAQGRIDPKECLLCLDCMVMYYDDHACPPLAQERKRRTRAGETLTPIGADGHFIALASVKRELAARAHETRAARAAAEDQGTAEAPTAGQAPEPRAATERGAA
jgi:NosR/NirI family nitrous oxide reductase transcriptional regulator